MTQAVLHAVIDPLCGWSYGAAPLLKSAKKHLDITVKLYGSGLFVDESKRKIAPYRADSAEQNYKEIANNEPMTLDSVVPIKAMMAIKQLKHNDLELLLAMQIAHFEQGQCAAEPQVLFTLVEKMGFSKIIFSEAYYAITLEQVHRHIQQARMRLRALGGQGLPAMGLGFQDKQVKPLKHEEFYGRESEWIHYLQYKLESLITTS
ncbi:hypothetical protein [Marinagarivorans algicola]|uniref:hypothetical protein n=1 Tax=Marinagarivorans algicola TaxID=1513270 RepID=UPI003734CC0F